MPPSDLGTAQGKGSEQARHLQLHRLRQRQRRRRLRRHLAHWQSVVHKYWPRASQVSAIQTMDKQTKRDKARRRCCPERRWRRRRRRKGRNRNRYKPADKHLQEPRTENMLQFPSLGCAECVRSATDIAADAVIERVRVGIGVQKSWPLFRNGLKRVITRCTNRFDCTPMSVFKYSNMCAVVNALLMGRRSREHLNTWLGHLSQAKGVNLRPGLSWAELSCYRRCLLSTQMYPLDYRI